jgi:hypothetical protein
LWLQKVARRERLLPVRKATPEQAAALPACAHDILAWIETLFDPYRAHLRPESETQSDPTIALAAEVDRLIALPELSERPRLMQELLKGLAPAKTSMPPDSLALALYAASSRPAEAAEILTTVPELNGLATLTALPHALQVMALISLRSAGRYQQLFTCLRAACPRPINGNLASGEVLAFALDTLRRLRPRRYRLLEAALAARLAATPLLGSAEHQVLCRYLLDVGCPDKAAARLRLFIDECDSNPWPVLTLARLLWANGNPGAARCVIEAASGRMPAQPDLAALEEQLP